MTRIAWTITDAMALLSGPRQEADDQFEDVLSAEAFLLDHAPASSGEAASMLEVVIAQGGDARSDGLDLRALQRVKEFLVSQTLS